MDCDKARIFVLMADNSSFQWFEIEIEMLCFSDIGSDEPMVKFFKFPLKCLSKASFELLFVEDRKSKVCFLMSEVI